MTLPLAFLSVQLVAFIVGYGLARYLERRRCMLGAQAAEALGDALHQLHLEPLDLEALFARSLEMDRAENEHAVQIFDGCTLRVMRWTGPGLNTHVGGTA